MTSAPSATTWGSPTATKHALLIHGLISSSHTWHRVASSLAAQGYFVTAPNLIGHASRVATDYSLTSIVEDLRPYLAARHYSVIIGHSLGAVTALALHSHLSSSHPTAIVLVDPPLQLAPEKVRFFDTIFSDACTNIKSAEVYRAENPLWTGEDGTSAELGNRLSSAEVVHAIFEQNTPWNFLDYLDVTSKERKVAILIADPALCDICVAEDIRPYPLVRSVVVPGAGHVIQSEFPEVIVNEALKTVAESECA